MKKIVTCIVLSSICCLPNLHSAATGDGWLGTDSLLFLNVGAAEPTQIKEQLENKYEENFEKNQKEKKDRESLALRDLSSVLTRALSSDPAGLSKDPKTGADVRAKDQVRFTKSAYASGPNGNVLYLGAENLGVIKDALGNITSSKVTGTDKKNFVLSRAVLSFNSSGVAAPMIQSLAPDKVTLNGEADQDNPLVQAMPNMPNGTNITNLTLLNHSLPVVTASVVDATKNNSIITEALNVLVVTDVLGGTASLQNKNPIKDAAGAEIDKSIVSIAATAQEIFAAVPAMGQTFDAISPDGDNRGVAVLRRAVDDLTVLNAQATKLDVKAYNLNVPAEKPQVQFAFFDGTDPVDLAAHIDNAKLGNSAALFWDDTFQRLFIGLESGRDLPNKAGGVLNLAVGRLEKNITTTAATTADVLKISPIVENPTKALFYNNASMQTTNNIDKVVGFYFDSFSDGAAAAVDTALNASLATDIIQSLHTTTGKDYLIVVGRFSMNGLDFTREIYAIPLLGNAVNADGKNPQRVGTLAKSDFTGSPALITDMPGKDQPQVLVGGRTFSSDINITNLFVSGDSVYICIAGTKQVNPPAVPAANEVGIFQSTAIFDANGIITAWTPFTRVMGSVERVFGGGLDNKKGEYLFVCETNETNPKIPFFDPNNPAVFADDISSVRLSGWGKTDSVNNLGVKLGSLFSQDNGGVHQLITFDEMTPGFHAGNLSVMLAVGLDRLALIQTGKIVGPNNLFVPETNFTDAVSATQNIFLFTDPALRQVGPLCSADFARSNNADEGWLFVGGYGGVAVLRQVNGLGFDSSGPLDSLTAGGFPGTGYSFKIVTPQNAHNAFDHVRKIACLDRVLYILTEDALYSVDFAANKFADAPAAPLGEVELILPEIPNTAAFLDFIILAGQPGMNTFRALLSTTVGLFAITHNGVRYVAQEVQVGGKSLGQVIHMQYFSSTQGTLSLIGNLYILAADIAKVPAETKIYRFAVNANAGLTVLPIPTNNVIPVGLVVDLSEFRSNIFADGSTILHTRGRHFGDMNYLAAIPTTDLKSPTQLTSNLGLTTNNTNIGVVVRDSASGALYAPGDWGVRANL